MYATVSWSKKVHVALARSLADAAASRIDSAKDADAIRARK